MIDRPDHFTVCSSRATSGHRHPEILLAPSQLLSSRKFSHASLSLLCSSMGQGMKRFAVAWVAWRGWDDFALLMGDCTPEPSNEWGTPQ